MNGIVGDLINSSFHSLEGLLVRPLPWETDLGEVGGRIEVLLENIERACAYSGFALDTERYNAIRMSYARRELEFYRDLADRSSRSQGNAFEVELILQRAGEIADASGLPRDPERERGILTNAYRNSIEATLQRALGLAENGDLENCRQSLARARTYAQRAGVPFDENRALDILSQVRESQR